MTARWLWSAVAALSLGACRNERSSVECMIPTYDVPGYALAPVEARHLASMCTEGWAKRWAVQSQESAGDVADAAVSQCMTTYTTQANAEWPRETWGPGAALEQRPDIVSEWRGMAVRQVIQTREDRCEKLVPLSKYEWVSKAPRAERR